MPDTSLFFLLLIILGVIAWFAWPYYKLSHALEEPFPKKWRKTLMNNFPVFRRMPSDLQLQLKMLIKQFIHEKKFIGCAGLEITDEIRVTIAAPACMLLLNRETDVYDGLHYVLVYPDAFLVERESLDHTGLSSTKQTGLLGESWSNGKVILSWADVMIGNKKLSEGRNVALHEFAHQLDHQSGSTNGSPFLGETSRYIRWAAVFSDEFKRLQQAAHRGEQTLIDHYGATDPAEFFAVVTEIFFTKPAEMALQHSTLFSELKKYYKVDPRNWLS